VVALLEGKLVVGPAFKVVESYEILGLVGAHCCGVDEAVFGGAGSDGDEEERGKGEKEKQRKKNTKMFHVVCMSDHAAV
jgi:hypothetical protein